MAQSIPINKAFMFVQMNGQVPPRQMGDNELWK